MLLEGLFGGGNSSSPPSDTHTRPTPPPPPPPPSAPEPATEPAGDETGDDDMPVHHDDGTYSPAPVTDENTSGDIGSDMPEDGPAVSQPVGSDEDAPSSGPAPVATAPAENEGPGEDAGDAAQAPVVIAPVRPAPALTEDNMADPAAGADDLASTAPASFRTDHVGRITDLIAGYEKLLLEPDMDENEEARMRAMELAQNRVLTSLIDNLSAADARFSLLDDSGEEAGEKSLVNKYYAEAGG